MLSSIFYSCRLWHLLVAPVHVRGGRAEQLFDAEDENAARDKFGCVRGQQVHVSHHLPVGISVGGPVSVGTRPLHNHLGRRTREEVGVNDAVLGNQLAQGSRHVMLEVAVSGDHGDPPTGKLGASTRHGARRIARTRYRTAPCALLAPPCAGLPGWLCRSCVAGRRLRQMQHGFATLMAHELTHTRCAAAGAMSKSNCVVVHRTAAKEPLAAAASSRKCRSYQHEPL
jgi:hypothetical protein